MLEYRQYIAICSSVLLLLPVISAYGDRFLALDQMDLSISTDKRMYYPGEIAVYTVKFTDSQGRLVDPDLIRATYDSQFVQLDKVKDGVYTYTTKRLTQQDHQLGVYAEKSGYNFVQQSLTVRPTVAQKVNDNVKATAVQQGSILKFRVGNDILSKSQIYKVRLITIGASVESIASPSWIKVPNHFGVDLKSVDGSIGPGEKQTMKLLVHGEASMVVWNAFDIYGNQIHAGAHKVVT